MLAVFLDVQNELREIDRECEAVQRKLDRYHHSPDPEDKDSHLRAIAGGVHGIYTGIEKILKVIVRYFDNELPTGADWHVQLLLRAKYPNEGLRPAVISEGTFRSLDSLRGFRHIFRGMYQTNLIPERTIDRANEILQAFASFSEDLKRFQAATDPKA
jgi:hypothetical protein